ncbi:cleft lip and palate transmembrane 1, partial [Meira miltonrushii]
ARAGGAAAGTGDGERPQNDWKKTILRSVLLYFAMSAVTGPNGLIAWYRGKTASQQQPDIQTGDGASTQIPSDGNIQTPFGSQIPSPPQPLTKFLPGTTSQALFDPNFPLDFYIFITAGDAPSHDDLTSQQSRLVPGGKGGREGSILQFEDKQFADLLTPISTDPSQTWHPKTKSDNILGALRWNNVLLNDSKLQREADLTISVPSVVQSQNGSIWADILAVPSGKSLVESKRMHSRKLLTRLFPEKKERQEKKLFDKSSSDSSAGISIPFLDKEPAKVISWWHGNLTLAVVEQPHGTGLPLSNMPPPLLQHLHVLEDEEGNIVTPAEKAAFNYPVVFPNDFWHLREHMHPINSTHETLPLHVSLYMTSFFKFQMLAAMSDSFDKQAGMAANEMDLIKLTLLENSPWYLGLTFVVSILHSLFEFLAFSSDVSHWRKKDNMTGVSLGSIMTNVIVQLIILLYLLDQSQDTSWMILASQAVGIVIEAWKLTKAVTVTVLPRKKGEGKSYLQWVPYRLDIRDRHVLSEEEKKTQEFDKLAFRLVAMVAVPLLGAYTIYSALYQTHKGWWSFVIGTLCSFVYAFGFVSLIPQLIVNYKLKSTAGMNSKTFVYKILGTFVDDLFAFAIRQPWLHRLACFRDDIVFMIFLYQRWIYGVDPTRVNEFGQVLESKE